MGRCGQPTGQTIPLDAPQRELAVARFTRLLRVLEVKRPAVSLHSLRHTLTALEKQQNTSIDHA